MNGFFKLVMTVHRWLFTMYKPTYNKQMRKEQDLAVW